MPDTTISRRGILRGAATLQFVLMGSLVGAYGQKPLIAPGGVVNAASYAAAGPNGLGVAPGSIISVFGQNLASRATAVTTFPLPTEVAGTSVLLSGRTIPLLYVSPGQVNALVPTGLLDGAGPSRAVLPLVIRTMQGVSEAEQVAVVPQALGVFSLTGDGCTSPAILNVSSDGSVSLNSPANPANTGEFISIYGTGLGEVFLAPPDGEPFPPDRPSTSRFGVPGIVFGNDFVSTFGAIFAGRAPGFTGLDQINIPVTANMPVGCDLPVRVFTTRSASQEVPVSIKTPSDAACRVVPHTRTASIEWRIRTVFAAGRTAVRDEEVQVELSSSPFGSLLSQPLAAGSCGGPRLLALESPSCGRLNKSALQGGGVTLSGPISEQVVNTGAEPFSTLRFPSNSLLTGEYRAAGQGGPEVGAFSTSIRIPEPIQLSSNLATLSSIPCCSPLRINWSGGREGVTVRVRLVVRSSTLGTFFFECAASATAGFLELPFLSGQTVLPPSQDAELIVTMSPSTAEVISASGLTQPGTHSYLYEWRFTGLRTSDR